MEKIGVSTKWLYFLRNFFANCCSSFAKKNVISFARYWAFFCVICAKPEVLLKRYIFTCTTQLLGLLDLSNCTINLIMFFLDQILINSHWELNLSVHPRKINTIAKFGLVCRFKKQISALPTVSFSARTPKTFVNYPKSMIKNSPFWSANIFIGFWMRGKDKKIKG